MLVFRRPMGSESDTGPAVWLNVREAPEPAAPRLGPAEMPVPGKAPALGPAIQAEPESEEDQPPEADAADRA